MTNGLLLFPHGVVNIERIEPDLAERYECRMTA